MIYDARHEKINLKVLVVVIPKELVAKRCVAVPILLLA